MKTPGDPLGEAATPPRGAAAGRARPPLAWRQIGLITVGAVAAFCALRWLPTGTNLSHMDFRVTAKNPIDFCDPLNPQFIPVVAVASPVTMTLSAPPTAAGQRVEATVELATASGKPIAPEDLLVVHTRRLHLLIVDPWLDDYQHVHPEPGRRPGEWRFGFTPRREGRYRVFADFTPAATGRGLYAAADWAVGGGGLPPGFTLTLAHELSGTVERDGYRFTLTPGAALRAGRPADLRFAIERGDGGPVPMEPVMGAYAHLVAFDEARSGFAHLHPMEDPAVRPEARRPTLNFKITIPQAGRYAIWAQVNLAGREVFVPFWFDVAE